MEQSQPTQVVKQAGRKSLSKRKLFSRLSGLRLGSQISHLVRFSLIIMVAGVLLFTFLMSTRWIASDYKHYAVTVGKMLADNARVGVLVESPVYAKQAISISHSYEPVELVAVFTREGVLLASTVEEYEPEPLDSQGLVTLEDARLERETPAYWQYLLPVLNDSAEPLLEDQEALRESNTVVGYLRIRVQKQHLLATRNNIVFAISMLLLTGAGLLLVALSRLTAALTRPLEDFVQTMQRSVGKDSRHPRIDLKGSREVRQLSESFNQMMHELEDREYELQQARDQALTAARLKSEFAANVSHEVRTPLNGIVGTLHLLSDSGLNAKQQEYIGLAETASQGLVSMINDILDFSRLSLNQTQIESQRFSLSTLLEELLSLHAKSYDGKPLDFLFFYDAQLPDYVISDKGKIQQILNNLLNNAAKFTERGSIEVIVACESLHEDMAWVTISVKDTGIGVKEEDKPTVFQPYQQTDGTMSRKYGGTGLGLAICEKLTDLLGGDIGMYSVAGQGSEFYIRIPVRIDTEVCVQDEKENQPTVLIYSDSSRVAESLAKLCERKKLDFSVVLDVDSLPEEANRINSLSQPSVVIACPSVTADAMPFWAGFHQATSDFSIQLIAVTRLIHLDCFDADRVSVFLPPFRAANLEESMRQWFDTEPRRNQAINALAFHEGLKDKRILLVEDNPINRIVTEEMLKKVGCSVTVVEDGEHAVQQVGNESFDAVLMDCQLPGMNGYDATLAIRRKGGAFDRLPIIAITANADVDEREQCFSVGMTDFIGKPLHSEELYRVLAKWVARAE